MTRPSVSHRPHQGPRTGGVRRRAYWYHPPSLLPVDRCAAGGAGTSRSAGRLAACVTAPVHPGALRGDGGQHTPLSPRSLVSRPPPRLAFGQGAGCVGDRGHEGAAGLGSLVLRPPQADVALVEGHSSGRRPSPDSSLCLLPLPGPWVLHHPACGLSHTLQTVPWLTTTLDGPA